MSKGKNTSTIPMVTAKDGKRYAKNNASIIVSRQSPQGRANTRKVKLDSYRRALYGTLAEQKFQAAQFVTSRTYTRGFIDYQVNLDGGVEWTVTRADAEKLVKHFTRDRVEILPSAPAVTISTVQGGKGHKTACKCPVCENARKRNAASALVKVSKRGKGRKTTAPTVDTAQAFAEGLAALAADGATVQELGAFAVAALQAARKAA